MLEILTIARIFLKCRFSTLKRKKSLMQVTLTSNFYYFSSNQRAISRLADSSESEPWTTFCIT